MSFYFSSPFNSNPFFSAPRTYQPRSSPFISQRPTYTQEYDSDSDDERDNYQQFYHRQATPQQRYNYQQMQQQRQQQLKEQHQRQLLEQERLHQLRLERERLLELQRAQELKRRQEAEKQYQELLRQQHERRQREQETLLLRRKVMFLRFTHAAKVIQRAFRLHLEQRRNHAAFVIQKNLRKLQEKQALNKILTKLKSISALKAELESLRQQHEVAVLSKPVFASASAILPNKEYLVYEDSLLKLMIKLDSVSSVGSELIRDARKAIVAQTQRQLQVIDQHKNNSKLALSTPAEKIEQPNQQFEAKEEEETSTPSETESEPVLVEMEQDGSDNNDEEEATSSSSSSSSTDLPQEHELPEENKREERESRMEVDTQQSSEEFEDDDFRIEEEVVNEDNNNNNKNGLVSTDSNWVVLPIEQEDSQCKIQC